jgi:acetyl esterase/lipase
MTSAQLEAPPARGQNAYRDVAFPHPPERTLRLDLFVPVTTPPPPLVLVIHGGGWREGSRKDEGYEWLGDHGLAFARVEYRLSHEATFPAQLDDVRAALQWLRRQGSRYGYDATRVAALGTSAGATLALLLGSEPGHDLRGIVAYCGPTDLIARAQSQPHLTEQPEGLVYQWLGGPVAALAALARLASPAYQLSAHCPPLLYVHGSADDQVLPDQPLALLQAALQQHVPLTVVTVPGATHCADALRTGSNRAAAVRFLREHLAIP